MVRTNGIDSDKSLDEDALVLALVRWGVGTARRIAARESKCQDLLEQGARGPRPGAQADLR